MNVLLTDFDPEHGMQKLTTRMVRTWRVKRNKDKGAKMFLRRSRLVAREYSFLGARDDVYSPATSNHLVKLLPHLWLVRKDRPGYDDYSLGSADVRDAFLNVPQGEPVEVIVCGQKFKLGRWLPGQRSAAKKWFDYLKDYIVRLQR